MSAHAQLKSTALIKLEDFIREFSKINKQKILSNERINMPEMLKMTEYAELNQAIADLNKYITVTSTPIKEERTHKTGNR